MNCILCGYRILFLYSCRLLCVGVISVCYGVFYCQTEGWFQIGLAKKKNRRCCPVRISARYVSVAGLSSTSVNLAERELG